MERIIDEDDRLPVLLVHHVKTMILARTILVLNIFNLSTLFIPTFSINIHTYPPPQPLYVFISEIFALIKKNVCVHKNIRSMKYKINLMSWLAEYWFIHDIQIVYYNALVLLHEWINSFCPGGRWSLYSLGGGQFDPHFLTAPGGLLGHNSFNFNNYTV